MMHKALILATAATIGTAAVTAPAPAEARGWGHGWGIGPAVVGGLAAGAVFGGLAAAASYPYGPYYSYDYDNYGYNNGPYYGSGGPAYVPAYSYGEGPAYYGSYAYDNGYYPDYGSGVTVSVGVGPSYYGYRHVVRPAYAYYRGPYRHFHHHYYHHYR